MALTLIPTVGGDTSNTYGDLAAANAYFEGRLFSDAWISVSDPEMQRAALLTACRRLEAERFAGWKTTTSQRLNWPRVNPYNDADRMRTLGSEGYGYQNDGFVQAVMDGTAIPEEVITAQFDLALYLLALQQDATAPDDLAVFGSLSIPGVISFTRAQMQSDVAARFQNDALPENVERSLARYRRGRGSVRMVRG